MAKGKAKTNKSNVSVAPAQPRSLRSRKRESDEISETDDIKACFHQDSEGSSTVDTTMLHCHHSPLQESTVRAFEERKETPVPNPSSGKDKEEMTAEERNTSPSQTCTELHQLQVFQISEEGDAAALENQAGAEENSGCNFEKNQAVSQEELNDVGMTDVKETTKEAAAGIPAKKKRRMGMCGLMERERSHFLQTQNRENEQNGPERVEKQICNNTTDLGAQEEIISSSSSSLSIPVGNVTEQQKTEIQLQSSQCGGEDRAETEVHIDVTTSHGTSVVSDPGCSKGNSCEVEGGIGPDPEQTGDTKSDLPAEEKEEELLGNQEQQEHKGAKAEIREETKNGDAIEAAPLQVSCVTRTREEELTDDVRDDDVAEAGVSSAHTLSGEMKAVELFEAAVTPGESEMKDNGGSGIEPGAGPSVNAEPLQTRDTTDLFGSGYLDYVSDSQLNTIILNEEQVEREEDFGSPDHEDATDLICGLIRELSSLNRKVMATHRELENQRRSSKSSRSCKR
ncbi:uncharacterized protein [Clinocottus analis]|uniref:uncharacterized protein n=1 Tax=Clinocottus analis TaxID=304258 RepID=UPI0035C16462